MNNLQKKRIIFVACTAFVLMLFIMAHYNRPELVLPKKGDTVTYRALYHTDTSSSTEQNIRVQCTKAVGKKRTLSVAYSKDNTHWKPAYSVVILYDEKNPAKRVKVVDLKGHVVERGKLIQGFPVPFHHLLFLPGDKLPSSEDGNYLDDGSEVQKASDLRITFPFSKKYIVAFGIRKAGRTIVAQVYQDWYKGDWLWYKYEYQAGEVFELYRSDIPQPDTKGH